MDRADVRCVRYHPAQVGLCKFAPALAQRQHCILRRLRRRRFRRPQVDLPREPNTPWGVIAGWLAQAKQLQFSDPAKKVRARARLAM